MEIVASQLLRAVRKPRSQVAFSRRLGYRSNPAADWEAGRRFPTAAEALRACQVCRIDVAAALSRFHPESAPLLAEIDDAHVAQWLDALRGSRSIGELAEACGRSRYAVGRWLSGRTRPRLPDFLRLVDAITGRVSDFVAELVPIADVPALQEQHQRRSAARRLAFEQPWTEAILRVLEIPADPQRTTASWVASVLELDEAIVKESLDLMERAGVIRHTKDGYEASEPLTVDTRAAPQVVQVLKTHWARTAMERIRSPSERDLFSYNVCSIAARDLDRIREILRATFREVRSIVAASEPEETVALMNLQLVEWSPTEA